MSTASGDAKIVSDFVDQAKALVTDAQADALRQDDLFQPTPEEMLEARAELGSEAGHLAVVKHAREVRKRGRPAGAKNKRTDDFKRYILGFGQHPAITLMQIQATAPELLVEASQRKQVFSVNKEGSALMVNAAMTYEAAQALRVRCAEALLPYIESKQPVAVDMTFSGVADMIIEGVTHTRTEMLDAIHADFAPVDDPDLQRPEDIPA